MPFKWIKEALADKFSIETRRISNFFVGMLDEYEWIGGNNNRAIKLMEKINNKSGLNKRSFARRVGH